MDLAEEPMVVLHVDLDCFYAAVEQVRLGIPKDQPVAVQQWEGLIAVNYPARAAGIVRHERISEALKKCPNLVRVHVETIGSEGALEAGGRRDSSKVSLERYRQASASVFAIFQRFSNVCEKASIDEAYLDITTLVEEMVKQDRDWEQELQRLVENGGASGAKPTMVVMEGPLVPYNWFDRRLLAGAIVADDLRSAVRNELGYTCSVGIATNKLLAKIASGRNKPDGQTLIPPRAVPGLMKDLPIKKVKLLGGKLGQDLEQKWQCTTAGEAQEIPLSALVSRFGERLGNYVWKAVRGAQTGKVETKQISKSMLAAKTFAATSDMSEIGRWIHILADELSVRVYRDALENYRQPKILQLHFRSGHGYASDRSKSCPIPQAALHILSTGCSQPRLENAAGGLVNDLEGLEPGDDTMESSHGSGGEALQGVASSMNHTTRALAKVLEESGLRLFHRIEGALPCQRLALAASGFQHTEPQGTKPLEHFFSASTMFVNGERDGLTWVEEGARVPARVPPAKPKGILKYVSSIKEDTSSLRLLEPECQATTSTRSDSDNAVVPTTNRTQLNLYSHMDVKNETRDSNTLREEGNMAGCVGSTAALCFTDGACEGTEEDQTIDLEHVDLEEQRRILEKINRLKGNRKHTQDLKARQRGPKRRQSLENRQESITKFFNTGGKKEP